MVQADGVEIVAPKQFIVPKDEVGMSGQALFSWSGAALFFHISGQAYQIQMV